MRVDSQAVDSYWYTQIKISRFSFSYQRANATLLPAKIGWTRKMRVKCTMFEVHDSTYDIYR
jgi:hypothetical protein